MEASRRLKLPSLGTAKQCEDALASRWVCLNPIPMFGSNLYDAMDWFGTWILDVARRGPGLKILYVDELWKFCDGRNAAPRSIEEIVRGIGRTEGVQFISSTQHPRDYHRNIRAEVTEWVCFNTVEPGDLDAVRPYYPGVDKAAALPKGSFLSYTRETGAEVAGKVF